MKYAAIGFLPFWLVVLTIHIALFLFSTRALIIPHDSNYYKYCRCLYAFVGISMLYFAYSLKLLPIGLIEDIIENLFIVKHHDALRIVAYIIHAARCLPIPIALACIYVAFFRDLLLRLKKGRDR